ncbi:MAG TPA: hypothetical protein VD995_29975 [Azospirillum sp.]|nr:hypothetical protein [Azospirillum sp.]
MKLGSLALAAGLAAVVAVTVPPKLARGGGEAGEGYANSRSRLEGRIDAFLAAQGYQRVGMIPLSGDAHYRVQEYARAERAGACEDTVRVAAVPINGEATAMLDNHFGDTGRIAYVLSGRVHDAPPVLEAYVTEKFGRLLRLFGTRSGTTLNALVAVIEDDVCAGTAARLPWKEL